MSKRCPECLRMNEDSRIFCSNCGATLDAHLRLIQDLEKQREQPREPQPRERGDIKFYSSHGTPQEEKKSAAPWIILGLLVVAGIAAWFFFH